MLSYVLYTELSIDPFYRTIYFGFYDSFQSLITQGQEFLNGKFTDPIRTSTYTHVSFYVLFTVISLCTCPHIVNLTPSLDLIPVIIPEV